MVSLLHEHLGGCTMERQRGHSNDTKVESAMELGEEPWNPVTVVNHVLNRKTMSLYYVPSSEKQAAGLEVEHQKIYATNGKR